MSKIDRKEIIEDEGGTWLDLRSREAGLGRMTGPGDGVEGRCCATEVGVVWGRTVSRDALADRTRSIGDPLAHVGSPNGLREVVGGESFGRIEGSITLVSIKISLAVGSTTSGLAVS